MAAIHALYLLAAAVLIAVGMTMATRHVSASAFARPPSRELPSAPGARLVVDLPAKGIAHAPTAIELPDGRIVAFWFAGSREAGPDVELLTSVFDGKAWSPPRALTGAARTRRDQHRYIKTLGNPVVFRHPAGDYWLIYVTASVGGWSGSALNLMRSPDALAWGPSTRLFTAPFANISTLVKAPPVIREDGLVLLPVYHEFITAYPELLVIDANARVIDKIRMGGRCLIQPWIVPLDAAEAIALMRPVGCDDRRLWIARTADGGLTWSAAEPSAMANPSAPAAALTLPDGRIVAVLNDTEKSPVTLDLLVSDDRGRSWRSLGPIFDGRRKKDTYRYPWLLQDSAGRLHVLVSESKRAIRHAILGAAALDAVTPE